MKKVLIIINWILIRYSERRKRKEKEEKMNLIKILRDKQNKEEDKFSDILQQLKIKHNIELVVNNVDFTAVSSRPCNQVVIISSRRNSLFPVNTNKISIPPSRVSAASQIGRNTSVYAC